jgi:hypothetical protein
MNFFTKNKKLICVQTYRWTPKTSTVAPTQHMNENTFLSFDHNTKRVKEENYRQKAANIGMKVPEPH